MNPNCLTRARSVAVLALIPAEFAPPASPLATARPDRTVFLVACRCERAIPLAYFGDAPEPALLPGVRAAQVKSAPCPNAPLARLGRDRVYRAGPAHERRPIRTARYGPPI